MFEGLLQPSHLLLIAIVAVLVFGPSKLPELGKGIGQGIKNFKKGMKEATDAVNAETTTPPPSEIVEPKAKV
jgi:sec-independent protein translocase protein TatA